MNTSQLSKSLSKEMDLPLRKAEEIVDTLFDALTTALVGGERIEIRGFGSFAVKEYGEYTGRNPATGHSMPVGGKRLPFFKVGKELRAQVDGKSVMEE